MIAEDPLAQCFSPESNYLLVSLPLLGHELSSSPEPLKASLSNLLSQNYRLVVYLGPSAADIPSLQSLYASLSLPPRVIFIHETLVAGTKFNFGITHPEPSVYQVTIIIP